MISKLKTGQYRLYSRKKNPTQGSAAISGPSTPALLPRSMNARYSISSAPDG
jgi:hypothetical protein